MFTKLLESGSKANRHERWLSASAGLHVMLLAGAVTFTPQRELAPSTSVDTVKLVWLPNLPAHRRQPARSGDGQPNSDVRRNLRIPRMVDVPSILGLNDDTFDTGIGEPSPTTDPGDWWEPGILLSPLSSAPKSAAQVDRPALPLPSNIRPLYPEMLRAAGIEGSVTLRFVIDTMGAVEYPSVVIVRSDHDSFASAVRTALLTHRFLPAEAEGSKVRILVEQRFDFIQHR